MSKKLKQKNRVSIMKNRFNKLLKKYNVKQRLSKIKLRDIYYLYRIFEKIFMLLFSLF